MFEFLETSDVPQYYRDITGHTCKFCGQPIVTNENRTIVRCLNPQCPRKIAGCIDAITADLGIKGVGPATAANYVSIYHYKKITDFFMNPPCELKSVIEDYIAGINTLDAAVLALHLPGFKEQSVSFFSKYTTMEEVLRAIDENKEYVWGAFADVFGWGVTADNMVENFYNYYDELCDIDSIFPLVKLDLSDIKYNICICVSGRPNSTLMAKTTGVGKQTKSLLTDFLNASFGDAGFRFYRKTSYSSEVDFLISDLGEDTEKIRRARSDGKLITSDQLIAGIYCKIKKGEDDEE